MEKNHEVIQRMGWKRTFGFGFALQIIPVELRKIMCWQQIKIKLTSKINWANQRDKKTQTYISLGRRDTELDEADLCFFHSLRSVYIGWFLCEHQPVDQLCILHSPAQCLDEFDVLQHKKVHKNLENHNGRTNSRTLTIETFSKKNIKNQPKSERSRYILSNQRCCLWQGWWLWVLRPRREEQEGRTVVTQPTQKTQTLN